MRPRADDDDYIYPTLLGIGSAHKVDDPQEAEDAPAGRLIVPDPEQRHGWREHYVKRVPAMRAVSRPIGLALIAEFQAQGRALLGWAVVLVCIALLWGHIG